MQSTQKAEQSHKHQTKIKKATNKKRKYTKLFKFWLYLISYILYLYRLKQLWIKTINWSKKIVSKSLFLWFLLPRTPVVLWHSLLSPFKKKGGVKSILLVLTFAFYYFLELLLHSILIEVLPVAFFPGSPKQGRFASFVVLKIRIIKINICSL
jgi:hypothetical protein